MIALSGGEIVLPDRTLSPGTLVIDGDRIAEIGLARRREPLPAARQPRRRPSTVTTSSRIHRRPRARRRRRRFARCRRGDTAIASRLPRYGVTAFCPTTVVRTSSASPRAPTGTAGSPLRPLVPHASWRRTSRATSSTRSFAAPSRSGVCEVARGVQGAGRTFQARPRTGVDRRRRTGVYRRRPAA